MCFSMQKKSSAEVLSHVSNVVFSSKSVMSNKCFQIEVPLGSDKMKLRQVKGIAKFYFLSFKVSDSKNGMGAEDNRLAIDDDGLKPVKLPFCVSSIPSQFSIPQVRRTCKLAHMIQTSRNFSFK
jgi:hypothetical protein